MGLDGVELVMAVEEEFGIIISDAEVETMITPRDMITRVSESVGAIDKRSSVPVPPMHCRSQRAFYRIRRAIQKTADVERRLIRPDTDLSKLFNGWVSWGRFKNEISLGYISSPVSPFTRSFASKSVSDLVRKLVSRDPMFLKKQGVWTKAEVREVVRQIISDQLNLSDFSDDDEFVRDLGVG